MVGLAWAPSGAGNQWLDPIEVYGPRFFRRWISIRLLYVGGNVFVAKAVGAENLPAIGGVYHLDPKRQFCRVSSSQLATY